MELKHLKLIKAIVEHGSISEASKTLFVTSSALSHQLSSLENELGCTVFTRSKKKWSLTLEGKEIYQLAIKTLNEIDKTLSRVQQHKEGSAGKIRLSTECYSFYLGVPSFIEDMKLQFPNIDIHLQLEATHSPIELLLEKKLDIALTSKKPTDKSLLGTPIFEDEIFALIHKENTLSNKNHISHTDIETSHLIIHSYPLDSVSVYNYFLKPNNVKPQKISAIPLTEVALEMIESNIGITCFPKWALSKLKLPENIVFKPLGKSGLRRTHYIVTRKEDTNKKYINDFLNQFINKINHSDFNT